MIHSQIVGAGFEPAPRWIPGAKAGMRRFVVLLAALTAGPTLAQAPIPGNCSLGTAQADLNVSDVSARLFNTGSLFFGNSSQAHYLVPRMTGRTPMFAAGIWVGGMVGGELRVAGSTYWDFEFWPGPLDEFTGRPPDPDDCSAFDRIWVVGVRDVEDYVAGRPASPDLLDWPIGLGAEVVDGDGVPGNYNLAGGDRPRIYGTQTAFWVMNDVGNTHANSLTPPIGLEVRVHAFAISSAVQSLNRVTVYRYTLVNRGGAAFESARFSIWADPDLGDAADDYVGSDTARGVAYVYNADNQDGSGSGGTYGIAPPAAGFDFLNGMAAFRWPLKSGPQPWGHPPAGPEMYNAMRGRWNDGSPITEGGYGADPCGPVVCNPVTLYHFPGDPVTNSFWSEPRPQPGSGPPLNSQDMHLIGSSPAFLLAPGQEMTFDIALVFGLGTSNLDGITVMRAASDVVQQRYGTGRLFDIAEPPASLPAPAGLYPGANQYVGGGPVALFWNPVPGAEGYVVELWDVAAPNAKAGYTTTEATVVVAGCSSPNHLATCYWRVRGDAPSAGAVGRWSEITTFRMQEYLAGLLDGGESVIETANPAQPPCPDPGDFGCENYGGEGNSVFRDPNSTDDYDISSTNGSALALLNSSQPGTGFSRTASPFDYEIRFTPAGGYAVYNAFLDAGTPKQIAHVPFEVWNVGTTPDDPSDDVRMIPVLRQNSASQPLLADWENAFPTTETRIVSGDTLVLPVTEQLAALFPDRPNGYDLFEAAAIAFGGAGATYDFMADGDTQIDLNPATGTPCSRQGYFIGFCSRNDQYVPPGGNTIFSAAFVLLLFADLAMDGTTPPAGTVVRLKMARYPAVANEPPAAPAGAGVAIEAVWPNPVTGAATVVYSLPAAGAARVVVYDVLGRQVAVLADGPAPAGRRVAALDAGRLAPGVYVVAVETPAGRAARTFTLLR